MISLANYIYEVKAPSFTKNEEGIKGFCEYVVDPVFYKYIINPDLTITIERAENSPTPAHARRIFVMDTQDLIEIPDFIVFSNIENWHLRLGGSKSKIKNWKPRVKGYCAGIIVTDNPKLQSIDLSECETRGGLFDIEMTGVKSVIGGHGEGVQIVIKKNKNLDTLDLKGIKSCMNPGSWIVNNKNLELKPNEIPSGIRVENNKLKEKIYIS